MIDLDVDPWHRPDPYSLRAGKLGALVDGHAVQIEYGPLTLTREGPHCYVTLGGSNAGGTVFLPGFEMAELLDHFERKASYYDVKIGAHGFEAVVTALGGRRPLRVGAQDLRNA